jgi:hypothetical protein
MNALKRIVVASATGIVAAAVGLFAPPAPAEVIGNWDFSSGSLAGIADSQVRLRHAPSTAAYASYVGAYNYYRTVVDPSLPVLAPVPSLAYGTTDSFGIQALGGTGRTVLKVPDARGAGQLTGLIADFSPASPGKINRYSVIMDVLIPQSTFDQTNRWISLFQPRANADGLLFVDTNLNDIGGHNFGVAGGYESGFQPDIWQRVALVIDLEASAGQPRYMSYLNGLAKAAIETPGTNRDPSINGPLSIGTLTDSNPWQAPTLFNGLSDASKQTLFFFNDEDFDLGELYVANLQFRDTALSAGEIFALGGPTAAAIAVPEPTSFAIAGSALLCLGGAAWRRQRTASSRQGRRNRAGG